MENTEPRHRSEFLTILCVLTFIGSGIMILSGINNYREAELSTALMREQMQKSKAEVKTKSSNKEGADLAESMINKALDVTVPEKTKQYSIASIICNAITLAGAMLMFRLNKKGFWVYLAGTLALVAAPVIVFGPGNFLSYGMSIIFGFIGLVFVLLYSRNLKYMN
jgi:hypothetical protein